MLNGTTHQLEKTMSPTTNMSQKKELAVFTGYDEQTIRNTTWEGVFKEGVHFFRPTRRHVLFHWPTVKNWISGKDRDAHT